LSRRFVRHVFRTNSGSLAIFAAIRPASSRETDHASASGRSRTDIGTHIAVAAAIKRRRGGSLVVNELFAEAMLSLMPR
jgi:hypothetical protein